MFEKLIVPLALIGIVVGSWQISHLLAAAIAVGIIFEARHERAHRAHLRRENYLLGRIHEERRRRAHATAKRRARRSWA